MSWAHTRVLRAHKPYFSYHFFERMPRPVNPTQLRSHASVLRPTNLIFHTNFSSSCYVPLTQVYSHASVLRPINLIFHTNFSSACHVPSTQLHSHARSFDPQPLFFIPAFRAHDTSRRPNFTFRQVSFEPTNIIFHTIFSSACYLSSTQVRSHASVH